MGNKKNDLIDPLLKNGKIFKLKCEKCKCISVQISEEENPDYTCFECGGKCIIL